MRFEWAPQAAKLLNGIFCIYKPEGLSTRRAVETIKENLARDKMRFEWAPQAAKLLNGIFCIYKPEGLSTRRAVETIKENLARDLNKLPCYKFERLKKKKPSEPNAIIPHHVNTASTADYLPTMTTLPNPTKDISEHRLVLGDRYIPEDFRITYLSPLGKTSTGLVVCGIGSAKYDIMKILSMAQFLNVYHVKGRFGYCTQDFSPSGPLIQRTTFHHINKVLVDKVCATIQSNHQKHIFEYAGVHPQSEEAYQMASKGLVRPNSRDTPPMIYSVKCINFNLPDITLEIHAINEECMYLAQVVDDLGLKLKSSAVCPQVRRLRQGHFTLDCAILRKDWHLEQILENIELCRSFISAEKLVTDFNIELSNNDIKQLSDGQQNVLSDEMSDKPNKTVENFLEKLEHV